MDRTGNKLLSIGNLQVICEQLRESGKVVVQCHGCFDIVHPGHIRHLTFARSQGDVLIVSITADGVMEKGLDRPYINQDLRAENLAALECVDYICIDDAACAAHILGKLKPDIYIKGKEYEFKSHSGFLREKAVVEGYGGKVIFSSGDVVYSSTFIINQFRERFRLEEERISFFCKQYGITREVIENLLLKFDTLKLLVVGDPVLDQYIHCEALGVADESPIISVTPASDEWFLGAGGLVAAQCVALGVKVGFLTSLGRDEHAPRFKESIEKAGIELLHIGIDERPTYVKVRYLVDENKTFKVDIGRPVPLSTAAINAILATLPRVIADYDAVALIDFGYGLFSGGLSESIPRLASERKKPYYLDVSSRQSGILKFKNVRLTTPTEKEIRFAFADNQSGISNLASRYYRETDTDQLIITQGKRGVLIFSPPEAGSDRLRTDHLPAFASNAVDTVGAGDVFHATSVLSDLAGASPQLAGYLGSCMAALHVNRLGNEPVSLIDLQDYLSHRKELVE